MELNVKIKQEYVGGIVFDKYSLRKNKLTIESKDEKLDGLVFISETKTPRDKYGFYGLGKTDYYFDDKSPMFPTLEKAIEWKLKQS